MIGKKKLSLYLSLFFICILTFPNISLPQIDKLEVILKVLKVIAVLYIGLEFICSNKKIGMMTKYVSICCIVFTIFTFLNGKPVSYFLKFYLFNVAIVFLFEIAYKKHGNIFIEKLCNYYLIISILNLFVVIVSVFFKLDNYTQYNMFLLGFDNRFILYYACPIIGYNFLMKYNTKLKKRLLLSYFVGLISLVIVWSAAAMVTMILMLILFSVLKRIKKNVNIHYIVLGIFVISFLIAVFNLQNHFAYLIQNILHKSLDLSYRTKIWSKVLSELNDNPIHYLIGFGFFNTTDYFIIIDRLNVGVIHCHNLIMNNLFFTGIIGSICYYYMLIKISSRINNADKNLKNINLCVYVGFMILMIFDTFEFYSIYYLILVFLYYLNNYNFERKDNETK